MQVKQYIHSPYHHPSSSLAESMQVKQYIHYTIPSSIIIISRVHAVQTVHSLHHTIIHHHHWQSPCRSNSTFITPYHHSSSSLAESMQVKQYIHYTIPSFIIIISRVHAGQTEHSLLRHHTIIHHHSGAVNAMGLRLRHSHFK
jgi:hypothetical protein